MRAILDTSVLLSAEVPPIDADLSISVASLAELHVGVLVARDAGRRAERLRRLTLIERHFSALPIDDAVARSYGQLAAAVTAFGRQPRARVMDLLIAATARTHDAVLYTWNPGDLAGLGDLVEIRTPAT